MAKMQTYAALFVAYFIFAILLNSVGVVILQSISYFGASRIDASTLEGFKDLPIAAVSFLIAASLPKFGYKRAMIASLLAVGAACLAMPLLDNPRIWRNLFWMRATRTAMNTRWQYPISISGCAPTTIAATQGPPQT